MTREMTKAAHSLAAVLAVSVFSAPLAAQGSSDDIRIIPPSETPTEPRAPRAPSDTAPPAAVPASDGPSILAIFAHPDDEIMVAPILARTMRSGGEVTIAFATSGGAGPGVSGMEPGPELAALRESEGRCAAFAIGAPEPIFWQLDDGGLGRKARARDSAAKDMRERIAALITVERPSVIMTWGPDGGYGHSDHRAVSNLVTEVVQSMEPGRPELLYFAIPAEDRPDVPGIENWATLHPSLITDRLRYEFADLEAARLAFDCYQSQFSEEARTVLPTLLHQYVWRGSVAFRLAIPGGL